MDKIGMTIRYIVAGLGAGLVGFGFANSADVASAVASVESLVGAIGFLGAFAAAVYNKIKGNA